MNLMQFEENHLSADKETLAENIRLLYVALTRAKHRCYFVWGKINEAETSALAFLLHYFGTVDRKNIVEDIGNNVKSFNNIEIKNHLKLLADKSDAAIEVYEMPVVAPELISPVQEIPEKLDFKSFNADINKSWRISSFSSLIYRQPHAEEFADYDAAVSADQITQTAPPEESSGIFAFPRGTKTGTFLHKILEIMNFTEDNDKIITNLIIEKLAEFGFELDWLPVIFKMIQNILNIPLEPTRKDFTLSRIEENQRLNELEFYFPIKSLSPVQLKA